MHTNAQYIGHWMYRGAVVRWDNHPSIIDTPTFLRTFNYLSPVTIEGNENEQYVPIQQNARPTKDEKRPVERPLCAGLIVAENEGKWLNVGTNWVSALQHYTYVLWSGIDDKYIWGRKADDVDAAIIDLVRGKLISTFDKDVWAKTAEARMEIERQRQEMIRNQLEELQATMDNLIASLSALTNTEMIIAAQHRYEEAQREYRKLESDLAGARTSSPQVRHSHARISRGSRPGTCKWCLYRLRKDRYVL